MNPYDTLGVPRNSPKEVVKKKYREIALLCHPDKLTNLEDVVEKEKRIQKFKDASIAYDNIINNKHQNEEEFSSDNWYDIWNVFFETEDKGELFKDVFFDIASSFVNNDVKPRNYYNPVRTEKQVHEITLKATYNEVLNNTKKKLRLLLVDIDDPVFVDVYCQQTFPKVIEYNDDNNIDHEIIIHMILNEYENFENIENDDGTIDLITSLGIDIAEYIKGCVKKLPYVNNQMVEVSIPPLTETCIKMEGYGLKGGVMYVNISMNNVNEKQWNKLNDHDKLEMIRITEIMCKTI